MVNRKAILVTIGGVTAIATLIALMLISNSHTSQVNSSRSTDTSQSTINPPYETLLPDGKTVNQLGGWHKLESPKGDVAYTFTDSVNGVAVSVSQQPLPQTFKTDTNTKVAALAKSDNATDSLDINGTTAYIGTSAKGPQSVYYTKNNLLILIKSEATLPDTTWKKYISSLQ